METGVYVAPTTAAGPAVTIDHTGDPGSLPMASTAPRRARPIPAIDGYDIEHELGRGGMGVVYKARHRKLDRLVALKMIIGGAAADDEYRHRFQIEVQAVARLQHPSIVQIFDVGEHDGQPYCAFEFLEGGTLAGKFDGEPLAPEDAARLVETLARGIHAAHQAGIIHRDLKPANVLLGRDGSPKISDFGLAKRLDTDVTQTQSGMIMGTPGYMAPEQAAGRIRQLGPWTDVYSLGAILYELLAGRPPFVGDTGWDVLHKVVGEEPTPPSRLQSSIPRDLETVCLKCLEKDPERRYASAEELADELRRFLDGNAIEARPASQLSRTLRRARKHPGLASSVAMVFASVVCLGVAASVAWTMATRRSTADEPFSINTPVGLPPVDVPGDNLLTAEKVALGKQLFFDKRLSVDNSVACVSCHDPAKGWSDGEPRSVGVRGQLGRRSAPTLINVAYQKWLFWDGRAHSLEHQALAPVYDPGEMAMPGQAELEQKLNAIPGYRAQFQKVFGTDVTAGNIAKAIAAFQRTLVCGDTPFDRYEAGDSTALSPAARRGRDLFLNKAHCSACHAGPHLTDQAFHNIGIGVGSDEPDLGRFLVHGQVGNKFAFKTPGLRGISRHPPYMHDGSLPTLEAVVDYYDTGGTPNDQLDEEIFPLHLSPEEKRDLVTFLEEGLVSPDYPLVQAPELPK
jgi:cytochrome c peroxidase/tRNA A-37 threonylcarbamoyl transferase component Bud32